MFWKKEKPKFEIHPLHSIREELELIKEFCWQPKLAAGKIYTEQEIDAVERRLNVKLPQPSGNFIWYWATMHAERKTSISA